MAHEAAGEYGEAGKIYDDMLKENPANALVMKRKVCILKAQGKTVEAIKEVNKLITIFQADPSAWQELGELHLSLGNYKAAAFCYEELVLGDPMSYLHHCRLAELLYTVGGADNLRAARKYFSQSLHLKPKNPRALVGVAMSAAALAKIKKQVIGLA